MLKYPANASIVNEFIINLVFFELIPTGWIDELVYYAPEEEPYNVNMQMFEIASLLLVANAGTSMWTVFFYLAMLATFGMFYRILCCRRRLANKLFWNPLIRLVAEMFLEMMMLSALNLHTVDWDSPFAFVKYSNTFSIFMIMALLISPLVLNYVLWKKRAEWSTDNFNDKHGALFDGVKTESTLISKSATLFYVMSFFLRRIVFVAALFLFERQVWL